MLVAVDELRAYMSGLPLSNEARANAAAVLSGVQQELETYLNRPLEPVQVRETITTDWSGQGIFSITPVLKVLSATATDQFFPAVGPYVPAPMERDPLVSGDGRLVNNVGVPLLDANVPSARFWSGSPFSYYVVEYVAGYNGYAIDGLKLDIMRVAARDIGHNYDDTVSLRSDNAERATEGDTRTTGWTDAEKLKWQRYQRRVVV